MSRRLTCRRSRARHIASWNYPMSVQVHAELVQVLAGNAVVAARPFLRLRADEAPTGQDPPDRRHGRHHKLAIIAWCLAR
jgi:hypothetical protein